MDEEQRAELHRIREEQGALRQQLDRLDARVRGLETPAAVIVPPAPVAPPPLPRKIEPPSPPAESLEVRIGAKWFVRIAVVMLLAALVFLANYLYQHVVPRLGPGAKVSLLYLGAGAVAAAGAWLERGRQARENAGVLNYARVLLAGGLAAVYYVTYAAHHYERLRVIPNPLVAGVLLLGWTAFMTWLADRRNSQTLAAFSILLAYYASATSDVVGFTLVANLGLTAAAVFLVWRRRWTTFGFASLAATFGSYAFWRYGGNFDLRVARSGLLPEGIFLGCYWALFTAAAFIDRQRALDGGRRRALFVSLNNGALFALVGLLVRAHGAGNFWQWALGLGVVLLALGEVGRRIPRPLDPPTVDAYHFGGISLVTLGLILYFSGWQLSIILAVESASVLAGANRRGSQLLVWSAQAIGMISAGCAALPLMNPADPPNWLAGACCGAVLIFNAWQSRWFRGERAPGVEGVFALLGLGVWFALLEVRIGSAAQLCPTLAGVAVLLTAGFFTLRMPTALALAQLYLLAAHWQWLGAYLGAARADLPPIWSALSVLAATIILGAAWHFRLRPVTPGAQPA